MAITRAQIAKQLLEEGGRVGLRFGSKGPGQASREAGAREAGMGMGGKQRSGPGPGQGEGEGRNPMKQFEGIRSVNPVDEVGLTGGTANINFMNEARKKANPFGMLTELPGSIGTISRFLTPNPFGFKPKSPGLIGTDRSKDIPYWAQLGFSSEEEYLNSLQAQAPSITEQEPEVKQEEPEGLFRRFRAEGGPIGGEFDFESARQMYGLGKLVKKVTKTVKKIAKSPVGKAAIAYTLTGGLGNLAQGQRFFTGFTSPKSFLGGAKNIFSREGLRNIAFGKPGISLGGNLDRGAGLMTKGTSGIFGTGGQLSIGRAITAASLLPLLGIGTGEESEEEAEELIRGEGLDINAIRANPNQFLARRFRAEGGSMKEPVAKKTMPLLDMGGKEMDLRAEGGFVPIGRMEKADDVPARLSKNEFVFTADAVRNAGDGNVDKGAEVMYNMMKNLEAGGNVSKESQGLEGARKMFQTSQRLEEVL